jgi:hypothetical protein
MRSESAYSLAPSISLRSEVIWGDGACAAYRDVGVPQLNCGREQARVSSLTGNPNRRNAALRSHCRNPESDYFVAGELNTSPAL